jgi:hypothetical protein
MNQCTHKVHNPCSTLLAHLAQLCRCFSKIASIGGAIL